MLLVGLTGGIASGKTLVSDAFAALGVPIIDADLLAREAVESGSAGLDALTSEFGDRIADDNGELKRSELRQIIFNDPAKRATVDGILHPLIRELSDLHIAKAAAQSHAYAIYAVPLLVETMQADRFDFIIVVDVPKETQLARLLERDGGTSEQANAILDAQATREQRLAIAHFVIENTGTITRTVNQVEALHEQLLQHASAAW